MLLRLFILFLGALTAFAIPRANNKEQLQKLVRLPRIEFAPPLDFDRVYGFMVFPDRGGLSEKAAELNLEVKKPEDADKSLQVAALYDLARNHAFALREYLRALELSRRRIEAFPLDSDAQLTLAEALFSLGKFNEAQVELDKASASTGQNYRGSLIQARFHREKSWQLANEPDAPFATSTFVDQLLGIISSGIEPEQVNESKAELELATRAYSRALNLREGDSELLREYAAFNSYKAALLEAFSLLQSNDSNRRHRLLEKLFNDDAIELLLKAAASEKATIETIGASTMAYFFKATGADSRTGPSRNWSLLSDADQSQLRASLNRLQTLSESENIKTASESSEMLGCLQLTLLVDSRGSERSFRKSLESDKKRIRSWDLLIVCLNLQKADSSLVDACAERAEYESNVRTKTLLAKAYDRAGDSLRAQISALEALSLNSNDFLANLTLATLLMKRDDFQMFKPRTQDCLNKAQRQLGVNVSGQNYVDLALAKAIFYALDDDLEKAKSALSDVPRSERDSSEFQELQRLLGN
jgi:tetratricopeptide (TPR) repeat protein